MSVDSQFPIRTPAIRVSQPLGDFYAVSLPASVLLKITYSSVYHVDEGTEKDGWYDVAGAQREFDAKRAKEIARYVEGTEAAFPNAIILGANYSKDGEYVGDDDSLAWSIKRDERHASLFLEIPSPASFAAIIDGQHRLGGFRLADSSARQMELLCAVYLDLPAPFQAYLFATINFNQKKVDKSLAYELFGFKLDSKQPDSWPPEKLAVFLCRRLNVDQESPFRHRIKVIAKNSESLVGDEGTLVSTATVVEGLLSLFSQHPKLDRDMMGRVALDDGRSRSQLENDKSPLRRLFLDGQDVVVYELVKNYFRAVKKVLWDEASESSYSRRTVGIQAQFDVLKEISSDCIAAKDISEGYILRRMAPLRRIRFDDDFFQASGKGRVRIKNAMRLAMKLVDLDSVPSNDREGYRRVTT